MAELDEQALSEQRARDIADLLSEYNPTVRRGSRNRPSIEISLPTENLRLAITSGMGVIELQTG